MYHYLITKYRKTRERMQRTTPETAQRNAASLRQEIAALREEIREKSQRLRVFERYNQLEERMNQNTVFMRMKPETYHKKPMIRKSFGLVTAQKKKKTDDLDLERDD
jgi:hypothetical protein